LTGAGRGDWRPPPARGSPAHADARAAAIGLVSVVLGVGHDASARTCYDASATGSGRRPGSDATIPGQPARLIAEDPEAAADVAAAVAEAFIAEVRLER
jgi:hypothetical protein